MGLSAKNLSYRVVEVTPGIGQLAIFQLSGQRQVPVLVDDETVIADSSAIIRHLETISQEQKLIPEDPKEAAQVHLIEDWADTTLASTIRTVLIQAASVDSDLRNALLPLDLPESFRRLIEGLPCDVVSDVSEFLNQEEKIALLTSLENLSNLIKHSTWLVGNQMSIADIAVAAQLSLLKFPSSSGETLHGKGCPGFSDHPQLQGLFNWRDELELLIFNDDPSII